MGNSASSLPFSIDKQVGAPHDHNGWALHDGKATDGTHQEVSVFVGKKPALAKTPVSQLHPSMTQLVPALHHYNHCRRLRHPHILKVLATLDTDNPSAATADGGSGGGAGGGSPAAKAAAGAVASAAAHPAAATAATTGDLIVVTEPCVGLTEWLLSDPSPDQLAWGIECVVQALHFLHGSAHLSHGNVSPSSLYVTRSGDVKLWNFSLVTPVGPPDGTGGAGGPTPHFQQWEAACTPDAYRGPERVERRWDLIAASGVHCMDSYGVGALVDQVYQGRRGGIPPPLQKAVQRLLTPNVKMRPRLQPLLRCPAFDTPYQKLQHQLEEITVQPVEQKVALWQNLGNQLQQQQQQNGGNGGIPKDVALYKILPLVISSIQIICNNESMLAQDMYRREVLAMLVPLFFIEERYQDPAKIGKELAPLIAKLFTVPDRGVRSILLNQVGFMTQHLDKNALNANVFEPLCSGFNDSSPALRELTLKATLGLVPSLNPPSLEKLSRYLVRLQADTETSIRTNAVIFIARIAPHLSDVSRQKMLLPAYARAMKDPFAPCRLSALQSTMISKTLFTVQDLATKVLPSVMPLCLDPTKDVRDQAFGVVQDLLRDLQQESKRMEQMVPPGGAAGAVPGQPGPAPTGTPNGTGVPASPASGGSGYLSGISSWMSTSAQPTVEPVVAAVPQRPAGTPPARAPLPVAATRQATVPQHPYGQVHSPPVQKFAAATLGATTTTPVSAAPAVNDGWGDDVHDDDDDDDDNWGDDDDNDKDDNLLAFSSIGRGKTVAAAPSSFATATTTSTSASSGFGGMDDDPFAALGMKTAGIKPRPATRGTSGGGLLVVPKKTGLAVKGKLTAAPATKLKVEANDVPDGWDDF